MAGTDSVLEESQREDALEGVVRASAGSWPPWPLFFRVGRSKDGCGAILSGVWWLFRSQDSQGGSEQGLLRPGQGDIYALDRGLPAGMLILLSLLFPGP